MSKKNVLWCSHPKHDEILPNGKKKFWKTGAKPSHPKGKSVLNEDLMNFINEHDERIITEVSRKLVAGDYLCTTCFTNEESNFILYKQTEKKGNLYSDYTGCGSNNLIDSPLDPVHIQSEHNHAKEKLNQVFQCLDLPLIGDIRHTKKISHSVDEVFIKLNDIANTLLPYPRRIEMPNTFSSLDMSMEDAVQALSKHFQQKFSINDLITLTICKQQSEDCYYRTCSNCKNNNISKVLTSRQQIDLEDETTWFSWKKIDNRYNLVHTNGSFGVLLKEIDDLWPSFITHHFYTHKQREYIGFLKDELRLNTYIVVQLDFAQNFAFVIQQEVQCAFYYRQQATQFTVYMKVADEHRNMVIISDCLTHDN
ncbi:unnamed protein product, partial [Adineta steineri]